MAALLAAHARVALASRLGSGARTVAPGSRALAGLAPASRALKTRPVASPFCKVPSPRLMSTSKGNGFQQMKNDWDALDFKSKLSFIEMIGRYAMLGFSGSWCLMVAKDALHRLGKAEGVSTETKDAVDHMKVALAESEEKSRKKIEEVNDKCDKLKIEISQLTTFKDLLISREYQSVPVPGAEEKEKEKA